MSPICSEKQNGPLRKAVQDKTDLIVSENDLDTEVICACFALHLAVTRSSLYAARRQPLHKKLLTQDENHFWHRIKISTTGINVRTDIANTYPHCVN